MKNQIKNEVFKKSPIITTMPTSSLPCKITQGIKVEVHNHYILEESQPDHDIYFFLYYVRITNESTQAAQLLRRKWLITDGHGYQKTVKGLGVVGLQPYIKPGEFFEYNSFCPLSTPTGQMEGFYEMETSKNTIFKATIPELYFITNPSVCH